MSMPVCVCVCVCVLSICPFLFCPLSHVRHGGFTCGPYLSLSLSHTHTHTHAHTHTHIHTHTESIWHQRSGISHTHTVNLIPVLWHLPHTHTHAHTHTHTQKCTYVQYEIQRENVRTTAR